MTRRGQRRGLGAALLGAALAVASLSTAQASPALGTSSASSASTPDPAWRLDSGFGDRGQALGPAGGYVEDVAAAGDATWFVGTAATEDEKDGDRTGLLLGRLTAGGDLDTSVGNGHGYVVVAVPGADRARAESVVVDDQGRVVVAGSTGLSGTASESLLVARFTRDLQLDPTFGSGGVSRFGLEGGSVAHDLQLQPDGMVVVAGSTGSPTKMLAARLRSDGQPDTGFGGGDGVVVVDPVGAPASARGLAVTGHAKLVLAGSATTSDGGTAGAVVQLLPTGALDRAFGDDGVSVVRGMGLADVVRLPDTSLAVTGPTGSRTASAAVRLVRLSRFGRPAAWPGSTGSAQRTLSLGGVRRADPVSLTLQHSGKLVITGGGSESTGADDTGYLVVRTRADGRLAPDFGDGGHVLVTWFDQSDGSDDPATGPASATGATVNDHDEIVVGGSARTSRGEGAALARFDVASDPRRPAIELRQTTSNNRWYSCGRARSTPCTLDPAAIARFAGRTWPAPASDPDAPDGSDPGNGLRLQVQRLDGRDNTTIATHATVEGNVQADLGLLAPGHWRVRLKVPASSTTLATVSSWRYVDVG